MSNILFEDGGHERVVPAVKLPVQQLRRHVRLNLSTSSLSLNLSLSLVLSLKLHTKIKYTIKNNISNFYIF
jgi:hypothetical protein